MKLYGYRARIGALLVAFALLGALGSVGRVSADDGTVVVSANNQAALEVSITSTDGLTTVDPEGVNGGRDGDAAGACYELSPLELVVSSNQTYSVTYKASDPGSGEGISSLNLSNLLWHAGSNPADTFSGCSTGGTAFTTTAASWLTGQSAVGGYTHTAYAALTVPWTATVGTFDTTITFTVTQS